MAQVAGTPASHPHAYPAIVLCGFMAAGKSAAAREIAAVLGTDPIDTDTVIETVLGESIASFFEREGEAEFRRREEQTILELLEHGDSDGSARVIALGGGAVESAKIRNALASHVTVWCKVDHDVAWERASRNDKRPLAADPAAFKARFDQREPLYEAAARAILPSNARDAATKAAPWLASMAHAPEVKMIWAESRSGSYPAAVGPGATVLLDFARVSAPWSFPARSFCVADPKVVAHHRALLPEHEALIEVDGGEATKTVSEAERVLTALADAGARRDDGVIAAGGGVVGDLAGFCAATYQRGVPVVQVPSTLVAQVDSAYGGKTGVDLPTAKNYVGAYHQPLAVLADPAMLDSLSRQELAAGFVEVLKTGLIAGGDLWDQVRSIGSLDDGVPTDVIFGCARVKIEVVSRDERDGGARQLLNFGHTVGHAIETASGYSRYRHGEAVGLGLLAALRLSGADSLRGEVSDILLRHGLPVTIDPALDEQEMLDALAKDKKATQDGVGFVLAQGPGDLSWGQPVEPDSLRAAVKELQPK